MPNQSFEIQYGDKNETVEVPTDFEEVSPKILEMAVSETRRLCEIMFRTGKAIDAQSIFKLQIGRCENEVLQQKAYEDYTKLMERFEVKDTLSEEDFKKGQNIRSNQTQQTRELMGIRAKYILQQNWKKGSKVIACEKRGKIRSICLMNRFCQISFKDAPHQFCDPCSYITAN